MKTCKICNLTVADGYNLKRHVKRMHKLTYVEYFFKHEIISTPSNKASIKCKLCNSYHKDYQYLELHMKAIHNITSEEYYKTFILNQSEAPKCIFCKKKKVTFVNIHKGYHDYCTKYCKYKHYKSDHNLAMKAYEKCTETTLKRYNVKYTSQLPEVQEKIKETNLKRYGVTNALKLPEIEDKRTTTNFKKYGAKHLMQIKKYEDKRRETNKEKYGVEFAYLTPKGKQNALKALKERGPNIYKPKKYILPSGKEIIIQGYEPETLNVLLDYIKESDIVIKPNPISYSYNQKTHLYFPDFYIPSLNLIVEAKSTYILELQGIERNKEKCKACKRQGFNFILALDNNYEELIKYLST